MFKLRFVALLLGVLLVLLAACGGGGETPPASESEPAGAEGTTDEEPAEEPAEGGGEGGETAAGDTDAQTILQSTLRSMASLTDYQATIAMTFVGEESGDLTMDIALRGQFLTASPDGGRPSFKGVVRDSTLPSMPQSTVAIFGDTYYIYDPTQNVVLVGEGQEQVFSELYNLFLGSQTRVVALASSGIAQPTVAGEEEVNGFQTTRIDLMPVEGVTDFALAPGAQGSIWIDQETSLPVQLAYQEENFETTWSATSLSTEPVPDEALQPGDDIPADAVTVNASEVGDVVAFDTLDEATAEAGYTPLVPAELPGGLPAEPTSIGVQQTPLGPVIIQTYATSTDVASDTEFPGFEDAAPQQSQSITIRSLQNSVGLPRSLAGSVSETQVRGQEAVIANLGDSRVTLTWVEGDVVYTITSNGFGQDDVMAVAESLQ